MFDGGESEVKDTKAKGSFWLVVVAQNLAKLTL